MSSEENVVFNLDVNTSRSESSIRKLEMVIYRVFGLYNRLSRLFGVPADSPVNKIVEKAQHLTMIVRQLTTATLLMEAASGPIGWAMAGVGMAGVVVSSVEFMQSVGE